METITKTPVELIQERLAILGTRKEVIEKIKLKKPGADILVFLEGRAKQNDKFIAALLSELSNYGDGIMTVVERENDYQHVWKNEIENFDSATPGEMKEIFIKLESSLINFYQASLETQADLPPTIAEIISSQFAILKETANQ